MRMAPGGGGGGGGRRLQGRWQNKSGGGGGGGGGGHGITWRAFVDSCVYSKHACGDSYFAK